MKNLVQQAKETYGSKDASKIKEHVAIQFNITGEAEEIFYLEIKDGKVYKNRLPREDSVVA